MKPYFLIIIFTFLFSTLAYCQDDTDHHLDTTVVLKVQNDMGQYVLDQNGKYFVLTKPQGENEKRSHELKGLISKDHKILLQPEYRYIKMLGNCVVAIASDNKTTFVYDPSFKLIYKRSGILQNFDYNPLKSDLSDNILHFIDTTNKYTSAIIDNNGKHVKEFSYVIALNISNASLFLVSNTSNPYSNSYNQYSAFYNISENKVLTPFIYSQTSILGSQLIKTFDTQKKKWQILDSKLTVLFEGLKLSTMRYFDHGLEVCYAITIDDKEAFIIDTKGNKINKSLYSKITSYYTGSNHYFIALKDHKYGIIDWQENTILPFEYDDISVVTQEIPTYSENDDPTYHQIVYLKKNNKHGLFDPKTYRGSHSILQEVKYDTIIKFKDPEYAYTEDFIFKLNNKYGLLRGQVKALDAEFDSITRHPTYYGHVFIVKKKDKYGYVNWYGEYISPQYEDLLVNHNVLIFKKKGRYQIYDIRTKDMVELKNTAQITMIENSESFAYKENGKLGLLYIGNNLNPIIKDSVRFDSIVKPAFGYGEEYFVSLNGKWGAWNSEKNIISIPIVYDAPAKALYSRGYLLKKNHLFGLYNVYANLEYIPFKYDDIQQVDYTGEYHPGNDTYLCTSKDDSIYIRFVNEWEEGESKNLFVKDSTLDKKYSFVFKNKYEYVIQENPTIKKDTINFYTFRRENERAYTQKTRLSSPDIHGIYSEIRNDNNQVNSKGIKDKNGKVLVSQSYNEIIYRDNYYLAFGSKKIILLNKNADSIRTFVNTTNSHFITEVFKNNPKNLFDYSLDTLKYNFAEEKDFYNPISIVLKFLTISNKKTSSKYIYNIRKNKLIPLSANESYRIVNDYFYYSIKEEKVILFNADGEKLIEEKITSIKPYQSKSLLIINQKNKGFIINSQGKITPLIQFDYYLDFPNKENHLIVRKNKKYGLIDQNLNILLPAIYDSILHNQKGYNNEEAAYLEEFHSDNFQFNLMHYLVKKNNKWGLAIRDRLALEPVYDTISYIPYVNNDGWYFVIKDKKQNVFNSVEGKFAVNHFADKVARLNYTTIESGCLDDIIYEYTKVFVKEGNNVYQDNKVTSYQDFYVGKNNFIIQNESSEEGRDYDRPNYKNNGVVVFLKKNNKWGAVDLDNIVLVPIAYDSILSISDVVLLNGNTNSHSEEESYSEGQSNYQFAVVKNKNKTGVYNCYKYEQVPCLVTDPNATFDLNHNEDEDGPYQQYGNVKVRIEYVDFFER